MDGLARTSRGASAVHEKAASTTTNAVAVVAFGSFVVGWGEVEVERHNCGGEAAGSAGDLRYASVIG